MLIVVVGLRINYREVTVKCTDEENIGGDF